MAVQVLGKVRGTIDISRNATEEQALALAHELNSVKNALEGKSVAKVIYKPGKILNIITK
jgi:leucyl-tRNA synthetase